MFLFFRQRCIVKKVILPSLLWPLAVAAVIAGILHLGGDFPDIHSYVQPRLGAALLVMYITSFGLFCEFDHRFLKKLFPLALVLPLLWMGTFTWAYGFASLPEKKHLGDYYVIGSVMFALPYIYTALTARMKRFSSFWTGIAGLYVFFMVLFPFIYIGYYILFGGEMDMFAMVAVRATHLKEIKDFINTMGSPLHIVLAIAAFIFVLLCSIFMAKGMMKSARNFEGPLYRGGGRAYTVGMVILFILFFGGYYRQITHVFPIAIIRALDGGKFQELQKMNSDMDRNVRAMKFIDSDPESGISEGTHIVIIGESANRDHMKVFNPSYPENTTPWLSSVAGTKDFALGYKAYSNFPNTLFSLSYAMTSANQYGDMSFENVVSMVDVAKAAGYHTTWISFHNRSSLSSAGVTMIAERCDDSYWEKNYDDYTLEILKKLPPHKKQVVFINIDGSHYTYLARVPVNLRDKLGISESDPYHDYDLTIAYSDKVIKDIFEYAKANMNLKSMVYFSDHGENMTHYHTTSPFYYDMVHIPFFVYLSPDYQAAHPDLMPALKSHEQQVFTNDLAFETVTGIWRARTNYYNSRYDFSSRDYAINMDNAMTFERKKMIKDDPVWQK